KPLVFALEDLQWSDHATIDLLSSLAHRAERVPLLVVATYRPADAIVHEHPVKALKQDLAAHGRCREIALDALAIGGVAEMLRRRFDPDLPGALAQLVHARTDGNPLFVVNVLDYLVAQAALVERDGAWRLACPIAEVEIGVPDTVREMLDRQLERLVEVDRRIVEAAAVAGVEFSAAEVAAALAESVVDVEERCAALARRRQFLAAAANDARTGSRFRFTHALYPLAWRDRVPRARRRALPQH